MTTWHQKPSQPRPRRFARTRNSGAEPSLNPCHHHPENVTLTALSPAATTVRNASLAPTCVQFPAVRMDEGSTGGAWAGGRQDPPSQCWFLSQHSSESRDVPSCSRPLGDDGAGGTRRGDTAGPSLLPFLVETNAESEATKKSQIRPRSARVLSSHPHTRDMQERLVGDQQPNFGVKI